MKPHKLIVFGGTSSIAKLVVSELGFVNSEIYYVNRIRKRYKYFSNIKNKNETLINFHNIPLFEKKINKLFQSFGSSPVAVINFFGTFGSIESLSELSVISTLDTNRQNLLPFCLIAKAAANLPSGSVLISFAGAGIGGSNLDDSSLGYLAAKASMSLLVEVIDRQLMEIGVRIGLVSPGAFLSPLQIAVAKTKSINVPMDRVNRAKALLVQPSSPAKLIALLNHLLIHPEVLGGRTWSANFDNLQSDNLVTDFGRMRRVH